MADINKINHARPIRVSKDILTFDVINHKSAQRNPHREPHSVCPLGRPQSGRRALYKCVKDRLIKIWIQANVFHGYSERHLFSSTLKDHKNISLALD